MPLIEDSKFLGGTYSGIQANGPGMSQMWGSERCVNLYPEPKTREGSPKTAIELVGCPGLQLFGTLPNGPVRALWAGAGNFFAVGGTHFYQLNNAGTVILDYGAMAGSGGTGPCQIFANGTQLLVMDSSVATGGQQTGFIFNANNGGPSMDPVKSGSALEYMDGFYFAIGNLPADLNQVYVSDAAPPIGLGGSSWAALNMTRRIGGVDLLMQIAVLNGQMWMFGEKTTDVWYNAGNPTFPLLRVAGATLNIGLLTRFSVVKFNNTLLWIGCDELGQSAVYMANGLQPVRVSNPGVDYLLSAYASGPNIANQATAYGYREAGHTFYCISLPAAPAYSGNNGLTLCYDLDTGLWHERTMFNPSTFSTSNFPVACVASVPLFGSPGSSSGPFVLVGDAGNGNIYYQSLKFTTDVGNPKQYVRRGPHLASGNRWVKYPAFELDADVGNAQVLLNYSNDGGRTFPAAHQRIMNLGASQAYGSAGGGFNRYKAFQLGRSRDRVFEARVTDSSNKVRFVGAYINAEPGVEK